MNIIPFSELYHTEFIIREPFSKFQNWYYRKNIYSSLGKPKPSHTLLWFKNCRGRITDSRGNVLDVLQNQLVYTAKYTEYQIDFFDTSPGGVDTVVIHFQLYDANGCEIAPTDIPELCIKSVDITLALSIEMMADDFKKNIVCLPKANSVIYGIIAGICKKRREKGFDERFTPIKDGIELLENDADMTIGDIAHACGVSECYFRRLFREYSGESPIEFRQKHRIEKAKQLLASEMLTVNEIAEELHFADIYHFSKTFKSYTGFSPKSYIKRNDLS